MAFNTNIASVLGIETDTYKNIVSCAAAMQSSESLNTSLRNVLDLFIRTGNVLKVSITRMNRDVKRSEMEKYVNDHTLIVKSIERLSYMDVSDLDVDIPFGMKGKYIDVLTMLEGIFKNLEVQAMLNITLDAFNHIRTLALRGEDISHRVEDLHSTLSVKNVFIKTSSDKLNATFTKTNRTAKFKDVFASMQEFTDSKKKAIDCEQYLSQAGTLTKTANDIVGMVDEITVIKDVQVDKATSDSLADSAMITAKLLDLYGTASLDLMSVCHNLTLIFNAMYTKVK